VRWSQASQPGRSTTTIWRLWIGAHQARAPLSKDTVGPRSRWRNGRIRSYPDFPNTYRWLAAALGQLRRIEEAKEALEKAIAIAPGSFDMYVRKRVPWMRPEDHAHMLEGLRKSGWQG
jgi:tetratricopeptide (TPR) repeat protein